MSSTGYGLQSEGDTNFLQPLVISLVLVLWLGFRPISGRYFGDTSNYALSYVSQESGTVIMDWHSEWVWQWIMMSCRGAGFDVSIFFTVIEAGYVLSVLWAVKRFTPSNPMLCMLFVWSSLSYFTFGVNGLRNGLACHIVLLAMSFLFDNKYIIGGILCLIALGIHRSTMLPIAAVLTSVFLLRNPLYAIYFWLFSIVVSLVAGGAVTSFFASLGFDDRMSSYTSGDNDMSSFSKTGFRWDFLVYSAMPVLMSWYVCVRRGIVDNWYNAISVTYCLCNAFWVMVIRSSFSNRFAYLSWFLYPLVIAYPLINMPVWDDQDSKTGQILLVYCGFTLFMQVVYW